MTEHEIVEAQRKALAAQQLKDNEIFKTLFRDMELALLEQMKWISPDDPRFIAFGRHLHALGDIETYIEAYIESGMSAELYLKQFTAPN